MTMLRALLTANRRPCRVQLEGGMSAPARLRVFAPDGWQFLDGSTERAFASVAEAASTIPGETLILRSED
jgi:hypothetical protein